MKKFYCVLTAIVVMMMFVGCPDGTNGENGNVGNNDVTVNVAVPSYTVIFSEMADKERCQRWYAKSVRLMMFLNVNLAVKDIFLQVGMDFCIGGLVV